MKLALVVSYPVVLCIYQILTFPVLASDISDKYSVEGIDLHVPTLEEIADGLKTGLSINYKVVEVSVVDCPDLSQKPFSLAGKGLSGSATLVDVGSTDYLLPKPDKSKIYELKDIVSNLKMNPAFILGAGMGPFIFVGSPSELTANLAVDNGKVHSLSRAAHTNEDNPLFTITPLPDEVSYFSYMGHFFISEGKPSKVIQVKCSKRFGTDNFYNATRKGLVKAFPDRTVGIGGAYLMTNSKIQHHIINRNYDQNSLPAAGCQTNPRCYYDMHAPMVSVGSMLTSDAGLTFRPSHFHSFSDHGEGGHYEIDLEPDLVEYLAYFNVALKAVRIDRPKVA